MSIGRFARPLAQRGRFAPARTGQRLRLSSAQFFSPTEKKFSGSEISVWTVSNWGLHTGGNEQAFGRNDAAGDSRASRGGAALVIVEGAGVAGRRRRAKPKRRQPEFRRHPYRPARRDRASPAHGSRRRELPELRSLHEAVLSRVDALRDRQSGRSRSGVPPVAQDLAPLPRHRPTDPWGHHQPVGAFPGGVPVHRGHGRTRSDPRQHAEGGGSAPPRRRRGEPRPSGSAARRGASGDHRPRDGALPQVRAADGPAG